MSQNPTTDFDEPFFWLLSKLSPGTSVHTFQARLIGLAYESPYFLGISTGKLLGKEEATLFLFEREQLVSLFGEDLGMIIVDHLQSNPGVFYIAESGSFVGNAEIEGIVTPFSYPLLEEHNCPHALKVTTVVRHESDEAASPLRGSLIIPTDSPIQASIIMSDKTQKTIAELLEPYANDPILPHLLSLVTAQLARSDQGNAWLRIGKCHKCQKQFLYWSLELFDDPPQVENELLCRSCGSWKYVSLLKSPYSFTYGISLVSRIVDAFARMTQQKFSRETVQNLINATEGYMPARSLGEASFALNRLRRLILENYFDYVDSPGKISARQERRLLFKKKLEAMIEYCFQNHYSEVSRMVDELEDIASPLSEQVTEHIYQLEKDLQHELHDDTFNLLYPHPLRHNELDLYSSFENVLQRNLKRILDLYKDLYDLISDHRFVASLGEVFNGKQFNKSMISLDEFGKKLVDKTKQSLTNTPIFVDFQDLYDNKIRNAFGHPGHVIDWNKKEIIFYSKGKPSFNLSIDEVIDKVLGIVDFHQEILDSRAELWYRYHKDVVRRKGILDIDYSLDDVEDPNGDMIMEQQPSLEVRQYWSFSELNNDNYDWLQEIELIFERDRDDRFWLLTATLPDCVTNPSLQLYFPSQPYRSSWVLVGRVIWFLWRAIELKQVDILHRSFFPPFAQFYRKGLYPERWEYDDGKYQRLYSEHFDEKKDIPISNQIETTFKSIVGFNNLVCTSCNGKNLVPITSFIDIKVDDSPRKKHDPLLYLHVVYQCLECSEIIETIPSVYGSLESNCQSILFPRCFAKDYTCPFEHACLSRTRLQQDMDIDRDLANFGEDAFKIFHELSLQSEGVIFGVLGLTYDITRYLEGTAKNEMIEAISNLLKDTPDISSIIYYMYRDHRSKRVNVDLLANSPPQWLIYSIDFLRGICRSKNIPLLQITYHLLIDLHHDKMTFDDDE